MLLVELPAQIMLEAIRENKRQKDMGIIQKHIKPVKLATSFIWEDSVKGRKYWQEINEGVKQESEKAHG